MARTTSFRPPARTPVWSLTSSPTSFGGVLLLRLSTRSGSTYNVRDIRAGGSAAIRNRAGLVGRLRLNRDVISATTGDGCGELEPAGCADRQVVAAIVLQHHRARESRDHATDRVSSWSLGRGASASEHRKQEGRHCHQRKHA